MTGLGIAADHRDATVVATFCRVVGTSGVGEWRRRVRCAEFGMNILQRTAAALAGSLAALDWRNPSAAFLDQSPVAAICRSPRLPAPLGPLSRAGPAKRA
jgi:hypothetical protein